MLETQCLTKTYITMKKLLYIIPLLLGMTLASCEYDDSGIWDKLDEYGESIKNHEERISTLEEMCKKMNTNISALQTVVEALENNDYVTNVSPIREDGEIVGYTISFSKSDTITIYHGQDGADGTNGSDGKDGYTPQIGVMKDLDGVYYWTLDGEWLLDGKGNKIKAVGVDGENGINGENGSDGTNGTDGIDGITPRLKIENDYWCVSYDNGATWELLGKATGEDGKDGADGENGADGEDGKDGADGADGEDGKDGDNIFSSVTQDDEYVYFNMADGTMITLPKHEKENIQFEDLQVKAICCKNWDTNNDGELSYAEAAAVETIGTKFKGNTNIIAFTELKYFTGITEIPADAFNGCAALWKISIPDNVTSIGEGSFIDCSSLKIIDGKYASEDKTCWIYNGLLAIITRSKAETFEVPEGVTGIGKYAIYKWSNLKTLTLPSSIETLDKCAIYECFKLEVIYCKATTPPALFCDTNDTAYNCITKRYGDTALTTIYVPQESYDLYKQCADWQVNYPDGEIAQDNWYSYKSLMQPYDFQ